MKYPDIIGSSDKKFKNYSYGKRPGKKLVKYSPVKAKINKLTSSIKNLSVKKGVMKGIKFAGKVAVNPLTLAFGAGAGIMKIGKTKSFDFPEERQFNRKGRKI
tara:strand:+ start:3881 stop:4189 length:309 start_codon:yes stop_codon:yes gene_type:complete